jgi:hypothetical protein
MQNVQEATEAKVAVEQAIEIVDQVKKRSGTFGPNQIGNVTPDWATWVFRIYFYLVQFTSIVLAFFTDVSPEFKVRIIGYLQLSVVAVHGFSKMWGIDTRKIQQEAIDAFNNAQQP